MASTILTGDEFPKNQFKLIRVINGIMGRGSAISCFFFNIFYNLGKGTRPFSPKGPVANERQHFLARSTDLTTLRMSMFKIVLGNLLI